MFSLFKRGLISVALGSGILLAGCKSGGAMTSASRGMAGNAVNCDKCKITWVQVPVEGGQGRAVGYTTSKQMECPDCKDAVSNFFATGNLKPECKACGGNMSICEAHGN